MPYSEVILSTHAFIRKDELKTPIERLRGLFTIRSRFEPEKRIAVYTEDSTYFGIPMFYRDMTKFADNVRDLRCVGIQAKFDMVDNFALRENQVPVFDRFVQSIAQNKTGFLLQAPTGFGKTCLASRIIQEIGVTTLVIVPRDTLVKQWIDRLLTFTKLTRSDIGIAQQDVCDFQGKKVVIGMIHSLSKDKYPEEFKRYFGMLIVDEVHTVGAETFSRVATMFPAKYRLGMTATPLRKDGMEAVYELTIGETFLSPDDNRTLVSPKVFLRSYRTAKKHPYLSRVRDAKSRRGILISALSEDLARNALIAMYAKKFMESGRRVLVFSDRTEQLTLLKDILVKRHEIPAPKIGLFTGKTKEIDRKIVLKNSAIILATYGVMSMGVDVPDLRAVIFATPLSDVAQSVGRILRLCAGVKEPVVLDIVDVAYEDCIRWARSRQHYYETSANAKLYSVEQ